MNAGRAALVIVAFGAVIACVWLLVAPAGERPREGGPASRPSRERPGSRPARVVRGTELLTALESRSAADASGPPRLVGRIVTSRDREPAPNAPLDWKVFGAEGVVLSVQSFADENGRFDVALKPRCTSVTLDVASASRVGGTTFDIQGPFRGTVDLGELELSAFDTVWFRVVKPDGTPVPGALARMSPRGGALFVRAGPDGKGSIDVDSDVHALQFGAPGFELLEVPVPQGDELLTVTLRPCSSLTIRVTTPAGDPMPDTTRIRVHSKERPTELSAWDPWFELLGSSAQNKERQDGTLYTGHTVVFSPVRTGVRMTITVIEKTRNEELRDEVEVAPGEAKVVSFTLRGLFGRLRGKVVGEQEEPIRGASVLLGKDDIARTTDAKGEFDYGAVPAEFVDLRVSTATHALWHAPEHKVEPEATPVLIRLEPGLPVDVRLLDDGGTPIKGASVYACDRFGTTDAEGRVTLAHLPRDNVTIESFFASVRWNQQHNTSNPTATIRMENVKR